MLRSFSLINTLSMFLSSAVLKSTFIEFASIFSLMAVRESSEELALSSSRRSFDSSVNSSIVELRFK